MVGWRTNRLLSATTLKSKDLKMPKIDHSELSEIADTHLPVLTNL